VLQVGVNAVPDQHLALVRCLPDGRWFDERAALARSSRQDGPVA